jgi:phenylacetate-CoA ligase
MRNSAGTQNRSLSRFFMNLLLRLQIFILPVPWIDVLVRLVLIRPCSAIKALARLDPAVLERLSQRKALYMFERAWKSVPAYAKFLADRGVDPGKIRTFADFQRLVPQTAKADYVRPFSLPERCLHGTLPKAGSLDESSGASGVPTNWIRTPAEDRAHFPMTKTTMIYLYRMTRNRPVVFLNGFLLGAWAGSQRYAGSMGPLGLVKNVGADAPKIISTMMDLGTGYHYVIGGYPPFLKELADQGAAMPRFSWSRYHVDILTSGEGFVEEWRDYMTSRLGDGARIFSNYGAIDTDAGISMETFLSVNIKRLAWRRAALRAALFGSDRLPCFLGQYSPLHFLIHEFEGEDGSREFDVTVLNLKTALPRIRYNVGDEGGIISFPRMMAILEGEGCRVSDLAENSDEAPAIPFPFLYIFGRSDGTVFFNGATIAPSDIFEALLSDAELSTKFRTFKMSVEPDAVQAARLRIELELREGVAAEESLARRCREILLAHFLERNCCYRQAYENDPDGARPIIMLTPFGTGAFRQGDGTPKFSYLKDEA